ncbi:chromate transporter [Clostridium thermarum]|uniref:chromate transporter n=1 Tax=Clostridium thermarum TaxID=1716543 RepID=UPI00111E8A71|nr:chromate transporter [Clostridium thermarum]
MIYIRLLYSFFKIGIFSFGGGYAMLPMISREVVYLNGWITEHEFIDIVAISQSTPGPISINAATYIGYKTAGVLGAVLATLGTVLPSLIVMLIICRFFFKFKGNKHVEGALLGLRPAVIGLIAAAAIMVSESSFIDYKSIIIFAVVFITNFKFKVDPIIMIIASGVAGFILY